MGWSSFHFYASKRAVFRGNSAPGSLVMPVLQYHRSPHLHISHPPEMLAPGCPRPVRWRLSAEAPAVVCYGDPLHSTEAWKGVISYQLLPLSATLLHPCSNPSPARGLRCGTHTPHREFLEGRIWSFQQSCSTGSGSPETQDQSAQRDHIALIPTCPTGESLCYSCFPITCHLEGSSLLGWQPGSPVLVLKSGGGTENLHSGVGVAGKIQPHNLALSPFPLPRPSRPLVLLFA